MRIVLAIGASSPIPGAGGPGGGRRVEHEAAVRSLGAPLVRGGLPGCGVTADAATVALVDRVLDETAADVVYVHPPDDSDEDHRAVASATQGAARRLSRDLHHPSSSTLAFTPSVFADATAHLLGELEALGAHASQGELSPMGEPEAVVASARHRGARARIADAEAFAPTRMVLDMRAVPRRRAGDAPAWHRPLPAPRSAG